MEFGYFHAQRQSLRRQSSHRQPVRRRHHRRSALRRPARHAFGLDRRASLQQPRRAVVPRPGARLYRGADQEHPPRPRRHRAAAAPSDPGRRAVGEPRSAQQRPRRFPRRAAATTRARVPVPFPCRFRRQPGHLRRGHVELVRTLWEVAEDRITHRGKHYSFEDVQDHPQAGAAAAPPGLRSPAFSKPSRSSLPRGSAAASSSRRSRRR